jgi:hypothetical protein
MTDADVDGAHIAALLMTFFYKELPELVRQGRIFLAQPPLFRPPAWRQERLRHGRRRPAAPDEEALQGQREGRGQPLQGLGEMPAMVLKETTMQASRRVLLKVVLPPEDRARTSELMEALMGRKPELRFKFIQEKRGEPGCGGGGRVAPTLIKAACSSAPSGARKGRACPAASALRRPTGAVSAAARSATARFSLSRSQASSFMPAFLARFSS